MTERPLRGATVLVTRPAHQSAGLIRAIEEAGGRTYPFPVIDIVARNPDDVLAERRGQHEPDVVIFVSANAVRHGLDAFQDSTAAIAAIGPATAAALAEAGRPADIVPLGGYASEHLLAEDALRDMTGRTVTIVRGQSGRELLAETLSHRGASVQYLSVYRTERHRFTTAELDRIERDWDSIDAVIVMSVATLDALLAALPATCVDTLGAVPLVGPGERVIQTALERLPGANLILSPGPQAADLVDALAAGLHRETSPDDEPGR